MPIPDAFQDIADSFSRLDDWEDRYRYVIELGQAVPRLSDSEKIETNKVRGCVSQVWLVPVVAESNGLVRLGFRGESDAMIVQGLIAILLAVYSGRPAAEIAATDAVTLFDGLGLREHLTAQRSNGLIAMINRMRAEGQKYAAG